MNSHTRKLYSLNYEALAINFAGNNGEDEGIDYAKATVDGAMNALIRLDGTREAAQFAFQVADRVVSGVRTNTEIKDPPTDLKPIKVQVEHHYPSIDPTAAIAFAMGVWIVFAVWNAHYY